MDLFIDLYKNIDPKLTKKGKEGIKVNIHGPKGNVVKSLTLTSETHEGYQIPIKAEGMYKVCLKASNEIFAKDANAKYEMSIVLQSGHDHKQTETVAEP